MKRKNLVMILMLWLLSFIAQGQWETVYCPQTNNPQLPWLRGVKFYDSNNGFAFGDMYLLPNDLVIRTNNKGTNWDTVYISNDSIIFTDMVIPNPTIIIVIGNKYTSNFSIQDSGFIAKSNDNGNTWTITMTSVILNSICFYGNHIAYISGNSGTFLKSNDNGNTWSINNTGFTGNLYTICFINDTIGFAGNADTIYKTTNDGVNWSVQNIDTGIYNIKIVFPTDSIGYCSFIKSNNTMLIYKTIDQGNTWNLKPSIVSNQYFPSMFFTDKNTGYICGQFLMYKTTDGANSWNYQEASSPCLGWWNNVQDVFFINHETGFVVGFNQFYRTIDGGSSTDGNNEISVVSPSLLLSPNPFTTQTTLTLQGTYHNPSLFIYNLLGQEVRSIPIGTNKQITIPRNQLPSGMYFYKLIEENKEVLGIGKMIVE